MPSGIISSKVLFAVMPILVGAVSGLVGNAPNPVETLGFRKALGTYFSTPVTMSSIPTAAPAARPGIFLVFKYSCDFMASASASAGDLPDFSSSDLTLS